MTSFLVVDAPLTYDVILERSFLSAFMVMAFPCHQKMKLGKNARMIGV